jgi:hypothetical protein
MWSMQTKSEGTNRKAINSRTMGAAIILVGLLVGGGGVFFGQAFADGQHHANHVTGSGLATIEYYLNGPGPVPSAVPGMYIDTNVDTLTFTGGMPGTSTWLLQVEINAPGLACSSPPGQLCAVASFTAPFAGTVGGSAPGTFTAEGTMYISNVAPGVGSVWSLSGTISAVAGSGTGGLAGICGGGTFSGTSNGPVAGATGSTYTITYDATFTLGGQCNQNQW